MAESLDALKFDAIIDDKMFKDSVDGILREARQFNTDISKILTIKASIRSTQIVTKASADNAKAVAEHLGTIEQKMNALSGKRLLVGDADALNATLQKVLDKMEGMGENAKKTKSLFGEINTELYKSKDFMGELAKLTGITFGVAGIKTFLSSVVKVSGEFEVQKMALTSMLQDAGKAEEIFTTLQKRALQSPYTFQDLTKYAKQLTAFNIGADQLVETEKRLADVAAGLGVDLGRIVLAYGQVKSAGVLKGTELRQFTEAGVPLLQSLADQIERTEGKAISLAQVFQRISKKEIPFEMVEQAFRDMTSEGGKFYNMQEVLVDTLKGKIDKLRDAWQQALYKIGEANSGILKSTVDWFVKLVTNIDKFSTLLGGLIATFGSYIAILALASAAQKIIFGVEYIANIGKAVKAIKEAKNAMEGFAMASNLANTAAFALAALVGVGYAVYKAVTKVDEATRRLNDATYSYEKTLDSEKKKLGELRAVLQDAEKETDEWKKAKDEVVNGYGKYLKGLDDEITKVGNLETAYSNLIRKVEESISMRKFADYYQGEKSLFESQQDALLKGIQETFENQGIDSYQGTLWFRELRNAIMSAGNEGRALAIIDEFNKNHPTVFGSKTRGAAKDLDKAYETFMNNTKLAQERMGFGDRLFSPEALLKRLASDEGPINTVWGDPKPDNKVPKWLKERIDTIKELQRAYKSLKKDADEAGWTEKDIDDYMELAFSWADASLVGRRDFWAMLNEAAAEMDKYDKTAANELRADVSRGMAQETADEWKEKKRQQKEAQKELNESQKALERYAAAFDIFDKDWGEGNIGLTGKFEKAIRDYNNENKKIDDDYIDAQQKLFEAHADNVDIISKESDKLYELYKARKNANDSKFKDVISALADDIFKKGMQGYDLSDWSDKTLSQINDIRDAIGRIDVPPEVRAMFEAMAEADPESGALESLALLEKELKGLKADVITNTIDQERFKKISGYAKKLSGYLGDAAQKMRDLADATGNTKLGEFAEVAGMFAQNMQAAADGAETWGGWWGAIIGGVIDGINQVVSGLTDATKASLELADAVRVIKDDAFIASQTSLFSNDSIFGTDGIKNLRGAVEAMKNLRENMDSLGDPTVRRNLSLWEKVSLGWRFVYNRNHIAQTELPNQGKLTDVMARYGLNVYDAYENLDPASIRKVIEMFGDQDGVLEKLAKDSEAYAEAMKLVEGTMEDLFGNIASSMADNIVDSWIEAGSAALDYADILDDVARSYAKMLIQSTIMGTFLDPITEDLEKSFLAGDYENAMAMIAGAMENVADSAPMFEQILSAFDPYFKREGSESNSLGSGIKGITEDTANLLASYINAILSDVSIMRGLQEAGWRSVAAIAERVASPTLNDYLAQCAANTFDIAQSNQSILSELQSVIGSPGTSGMVVRVEYA